MRVGNIAWTAAGLSLPLAFAALTVPGLLASIGAERFGILTLAWGLAAVSGAFDLGIGRATTQHVAALRPAQGSNQIPLVATTAERLSLLSGLAGGALLVAAAVLGLHRHLNYSPALDREVTAATWVLALLVPIQSVSSVYRGINEAFEHFRGVSLIRMGIGIATFAGPYLLAMYTSHIAALVATLVASRLAALIILRALARTSIRRAAPSEPNGLPPSPRQVRTRLLSFGGWLTISGIVYPLMMQADRWIISASRSAGAVAGYTIPYEIVVQTLVLIGAITTVAFPRLTALLSADPEQALRLFYRWLGYAAALMTAIALALMLWLPPLLELWLGRQLPLGAAAVGQILSLGLVPYAVGTMYVALLHALGRPDTTAKAHTLQAPLYIAFVFFMVQRYGIEGAAVAWTIRLLVDTLALVGWFEMRIKRTRLARAC